MRTRSRILVSLGALLAASGAAILVVRPARAEHFEILLSVRSSKGSAEGTWDTAPPEGGLNDRQMVPAMVGEDVEVEWRLRSEFPHGIMKKTRIRMIVARLPRAAYREMPPASTPRLVDNSFTADFLPHHSARGVFRFAAPEPGSYVVRLDSETTIKEHGHEHFAHVEVQAE